MFMTGVVLFSVRSMVVTRYEFVCSSDFSIVGFPTVLPTFALLLEAVPATPEGTDVSVGGGFVCDLFLGHNFHIRIELGRF